MCEAAAALSPAMAPGWCLPVVLSVRDLPGLRNSSIGSCPGVAFLGEDRDIKRAFLIEEHQENFSASSAGSMKS